MPNQQNSLLSKNKHLYENLWDGAWLLEAHNYNTWPLVQNLIKKHTRRIEIAPGLRPRLPTDSTVFVDISHSALRKLKEQGGHTSSGNICALPFPDKHFDLVCALDIIEHVEDDVAAIGELTRIAKDKATLLLSTPLHQAWWTPFDDFVGHHRRYEPSRLLSLLEEHGIRVQQSAVFGMKPKSNRVVDLGMWFLKNKPERAMWWYNRVFPFVARRQKELELMEGLPNLEDIGEVFMVCQIDKS